MFLFLFRWLKFYWLCHTLSLNWGWCRGLFYRFSTELLGVGRRIWLVFCILSIEGGRRRRMLASKTMWSRFEEHRVVCKSLFFVLFFLKKKILIGFRGTLFLDSGLKCLMVFLDLTGKQLDWLLTVLFFSLALSFNLLLVQGSSSSSSSSS